LRFEYKDGIQGWVLDGRAEGDVEGSDGFTKCGEPGSISSSTPQVFGVTEESVFFTEIHIYTAF